jgi:competence protein ComEC
LRLVWKEVSFLLTGDIYEEAERDILYGGSGAQCTVLKVAHHGSATSSCAHFLAAADPQAAVICVGADNTFGHPDEETLARLDGVPVYRTDEHGTVTFTTDGERLWVGTER